MAGDAFNGFCTILNTFYCWHAQASPQQCSNTLVDKTPAHSKFVNIITQYNSLLVPTTLPFKGHWFRYSSGTVTSQRGHDMAVLLISVYHCNSFTIRIRPFNNGARTQWTYCSTHTGIEWRASLFNCACRHATKCCTKQLRCSSRYKMLRGGHDIILALAITCCNAVAGMITTTVNICHTDMYRC